MREYKEPFNTYVSAIETCGTSGVTFLCPDCGKESTHATYCCNKICSLYECQTKRRKRAVVRLRKFIRPPKAPTLKLITLTYSLTTSVKTTKQEIRTAWKSILRHFNREHSLNPVLWWTGVYEVVFKKGNKFNVHLHVLADVKYIPQAWLSKLWEKRTGHPIVDIRAMNTKGAIEYLAKYLGKGLKFEVSAPFYPMLHYSFGEMHKLRFYSTSLDTKGISGTSFVARCPFCGGEHLISTFQLGQDVLNHCKRPPG